jgi:hemoglobin/transferrin/lactoferrin receptor protein
VSRYYLIGLFFLFSNFALAQKIQVLSNSTKEPIEDVAVYSSDQKDYTNTDKDGLFDLAVFPVKSTLVFQHPSFHSLSITKRKILEGKRKVFLSERIIKIDEVVISANKWEQNKSEIPFEILSLSAKEMSFSNPQTSADMLAGSGQVFVQKSQLGGGSPMIRGFGANSVLIVVDGVRMNNAIFRGGNLQNVIGIDPNSLESSEVIFGPGAVIYGSDALGGVMDFHTITPQYAKSDKILVTGQALARFSSANNEKTAHALIGVSKKKFSYQGSVTYSNFGDLKTGSIRPNDDPDFGKRPEYVVRINGIDSTVINTDENLQKFSGYTQFSTLHKFHFRIKDHMELGYSLNFSTTSDIPRYDRLTEYDDESLKYADWYYGPQGWMMNALRLNYFKANHLFDEAKFIMAFQNFKESRHDRKYRQTLLRNRTEKVNVFSLNADFEKVLNLESQLFYGLEYTYNNVSSSAYTEDIETGTISQLSTRYPDGGSNVHNLALYTSYKKKFKDKLFLTTGIRYSFQGLKSSFNEGNFDFDNIENRNSALNGNIGLVFKPNQKWNISGMLSSGFRAPNVDDISKVFDSEPGNVLVPNPELKPEYSYNSEISASRYINNKFEISGTLFYSFLHQAMVRGDFLIDGKDSILYDGELSKVQALVNTGKANIYGFNVALKMELSSNWSASMNVNYIEGKDLVENEPLRHTTPLFGNASVYYNSNKIQSEFFVRFNGKRKFEDLPPSERNKPQLYSAYGSPAWYTLNLRLRYQIKTNLSLNSALENILDHHYRTYSSGISAPGRNFVISLKANF